MLTGGLGSGLGQVLFGGKQESTFVSLLLGCVGAIIGAIAGTAQETVTALRQKPSL